MFSFFIKFLNAHENSLSLSELSCSSETKVSEDASDCSTEFMKHVLPSLTRPPMSPPRFMTVLTVSSETPLPLPIRRLNLEAPPLLNKGSMMSCVIESNLYRQIDVSETRRKDRTSCLLETTLLDRIRFKIRNTSNAMMTTLKMTFFLMLMETAYFFPMRSACVEESAPATASNV